MRIVLDAHLTHSSVRSMPRDLPFPDWVPKEAQKSARLLARTVAPEDLASFDRLMFDPRMERVWAALNKSAAARHSSDRRKGLDNVPTQERLRRIFVGILGALVFRPRIYTKKTRQQMAKRLGELIGGLEDYISVCGNFTFHTTGIDKTDVVLTLSSGIEVLKAEVVWWKTGDSYSVDRFTGHPRAHALAIAINHEIVSAVGTPHYAQVAAVVSVVLGREFAKELVRGWCVRSMNPRPPASK